MKLLKRFIRKLADRVDAFVTDENGRPIPVRVIMATIGPGIIVATVYLVIQSLVMFVISPWFKATLGLVALVIIRMITRNTPVQSVPQKYFWHGDLAEVILVGLRSVLCTLPLPMHVPSLFDMWLDPAIIDGMNMFKIEVDVNMGDIVFTGGLNPNIYKEAANTIRLKVNKLLMHRLETWQIENCTPSMIGGFPLFVVVHVEMIEHKWVLYVLPIIDELSAQYAAKHHICKINVNPNDLRWTNYMH